MVTSAIQKALYGVNGPTDEWKAKQYETFKPGDGDYTQKKDQTTIFRWFTDFGYEPTGAEIEAFTFLAGGDRIDDKRGRSMIANYVNTLGAIQEAKANDPSRQVLADERGFFNSQQQRAIDLERSSNDVYNELHSTFGQAPKLFGGLDESQIDTYLDPLRRFSEESGASAQTALSRRNLTGSSIEANAIMENERKFREAVLNTGLNVGLNEQAVQRQILQNRINQLQGDYQQAYGFLPGSLARQGDMAHNIGASDMNSALLKGSLPLYLRSYVANEYAMQHQPEQNEANFFQKYIVPFIQPAATIIGGSMGGPAGATAGNLIGGSATKSLDPYNTGVNV